MNIITTVIVKKGNMWRWKMSEDRRQEEERRCMKTKETMYKWLKALEMYVLSREHCYKHYEHWMKITEDEEKWKEIGYVKLCMNLVHYQLNNSKITHVSVI